MRRTISLLAALSLVAALAACGDDADVDSTGTTVAPTTETTESPDGTEPADTEPDAVESEALVYFAWNELIGAASRTVEGDDVPEAALAALLEGPDGFETDIGMGTEIPDGTELLGVEVDGGTATVDLSSDFEAGGGSLSMQMRVAQVVFTLTALDDVESVTITLDGDAVDGIGGEGIQADDLTRETFEDLSPAILVESPTPGEDVTSPVTIEGTANTFEATVQYAVTDGEGLIVAEGSPPPPPAAASGARSPWRSTSSPSARASAPSSCGRTTPRAASSATSTRCPSAWSDPTDWCARPGGATLSPTMGELTAPRVEGTVRVDGGRKLGFAEFGPHDGIPLVWMHGTPGARRQIPEPARIVAAAHGIRIVGIDRPGVGLSDPAPLRPDPGLRRRRGHRGRPARPGALRHHRALRRRPLRHGDRPCLGDRVPVVGVLGGVAPTRGIDAIGGGLVALARPFAPVLPTFRAPIGSALSLAVRMIRPFGEPALDLYARHRPRARRRAAAPARVPGHVPRRPHRQHPPRDAGPGPRRDPLHPSLGLRPRRPGGARALVARRRRQPGPAGPRRARRAPPAGRRAADPARREPPERPGHRRGGPRDAPRGLGPAPPAQPAA
jgi:hypothetical protein